MSWWRLDPAGVFGVLEGVRGEAEELPGVFGPGQAGDVQDGARGASPGAPETQSALAEFLADQSARLNEIGNRVVAGVVGVSNATLSYQRGDEEMAANFQREMADSAVDGDFSYFEQYGARG
ncbi:MAG: DUF6507 family protein [Pseudoclavibacter sp.]|nr:DUF6507 family protein [Pseudoclavibacter sp.]